MEPVKVEASTHLLACRFFSEGGDFAPQEVKVFQRQLTEEMKMLSVSEEKIFREQEGFQFTSFQQVPSAPPHAQCSPQPRVFDTPAPPVLHLCTLSCR